LEIFETKGLGVSQIYYSAITDYDYLKDTVANIDCPNARYLAQHHISLSTSAFLRHEELSAIARLIRDL
jgi:hypothetical protein